MPVLSPNQIKKIAAESGLSPQKSLGQNFLIDENVLQKIIAAAELKKDDKVLEIGPGLGVLTSELVAKAGRIIAVEKDKRLAGYLRNLFAAQKNLKVIENDFLEFNLKMVGLKSKYKIVANLPYSITSDAVRKIMEVDPAPSMAVLMLQKEVAERICAKPGDMSLLALSVQYYGAPSFEFQVSRNSFWPVPKVDSVVIKILIDKKKDKKEAERFFRIARIGFSSPRKQLQNNLASGLHITKEKAVEILSAAKINPKARPEELGVGDWKRLLTKTQEL